MVLFPMYLYLSFFLFFYFVLLTFIFSVGFLFLVFLLYLWIDLFLFSYALFCLCMFVFSFNTFLLFQEQETTLTFFEQLFRFSSFVRLFKMYLISPCTHYNREQSASKDFHPGVSWNTLVVREFCLTKEFNVFIN
jgi:hypothetical protein